MKEPRISVAFWDYDRTAPLVDGRVRFDGYRPEFQLLRPQDTFIRAFGSAEFDVCELSLSRHAQAIARGDSRYVGLPIFLSRCFRHASVYVRTGINHPEDLKEARFGLSNYDDTAAVVVRAILRECHGLDTSKMTWLVGDIEPPLRLSIVPQRPSGISIITAPPGRTLDEMLLSEEIDALIGLLPPPSFRSGDPRIKRMYPDWRGAEETWYKQQRIFPIMHLVGVRQELTVKHPSLLTEVYKGFMESAQIALANLSVLQASKTMLPWLVAECPSSEHLAQIGA
jgi:4,5-dihydroxyphthalate decarboxylase